MPKLELDESVPDYLEWLLKNKGLKLEKIEKSNDEQKSYNESMDMIKIQELEQTKELLVHLNNKLFKKIESLETREKSENQKLKTERKVKSKSKDKKNECKIEFTDLSWYREKLNSKNP